MFTQDENVLLNRQMVCILCLPYRWTKSLIDALAPFSANEISKLRERAPDTKESMEIGRDWDPVWKNRWPQESDVPGFKETMKEFYQVKKSKFSRELLPHGHTLRLVMTSTLWSCEL